MGMFDQYLMPTQPMPVPGVPGAPDPIAALMAGLPPIGVHPSQMGTPGFNMPPIGITQGLPAPSITPQAPPTPPGFGLMPDQMQGMWNPQKNAEFGLDPDKFSKIADLAKDHTITDKLAKDFAEKGVPPPDMKALAAAMGAYKPKPTERMPAGGSVNVGGVQGNAAQTVAAMRKSMAPGARQISPIAWRQ